MLGDHGSPVFPSHSPLVLTPGRAASVHETRATHTLSVSLRHTIWAELTTLSVRTPGEDHPPFAVLYFKFKTISATVKTLNSTSGTRRRRRRSRHGAGDKVEGEMLIVENEEPGGKRC